MRRVACLAGLLLAAGACAPTTQERVQQHTEDGIHLFQKGSFAASRDCFHAALALRPEDPDLVYNIGRCHHRLRQLDQAERLYQQCLQRDPDHLEARHAWVLLMLDGNRKAQAVAMVRDWRTSRPRSAGPYVEEGWLLAQDGDIVAARRRYQQALERQPRHPRALVELGALYEKTGDPERARALYERSLAARPDQPEVARLVSRLRARGVGLPHPD
jgi:Flp pilus assembly protein TadD